MSYSVARYLKKEGIGVYVLPRQEKEERDSSSSEPLFESCLCLSGGVGVGCDGLLVQVGVQKEGARRAVEVCFLPSVKRWIPPTDRCRGFFLGSVLLEYLDWFGVQGQGVGAVRITVRLMFMLRLVCGLI